MIRNDGFYLSDRGTVLEQFEEEIAEHPLSDRYVADIVTTSNSNIQSYNDRFAREVEGRDISFSDWIRFQEGLLPYVRDSANLVHRLHELGYTDYKVNMQSGLIK